MSAYYFDSHPNTGTSGVFSWQPSTARHGYWYVMGYDQFTTSGYAVVDDFGNLVKVPA